MIRGVRIHPIAALQAWLAHSGITSGPVFRPVKLGGKIGDEAMSGNRSLACRNDIAGASE